MRTRLTRPALLTLLLGLAALTAITGSLQLSPTQAAQPAPPEKFVTPHAETPFQDWTIGGYVDVIRGPGKEDCFGGSIVAGDHGGIDFGIAHFTAMDRGVSVLAVAPGEVVEAHDDEFDRSTVAAEQPDNFVTLDHGRGWRTLYAHLRRDSVPVEAGDRVAAGQRIGEVGSSGNSTGAHLHFHVFHNDAEIATFCDPETFWVNPLPYQGEFDTVLGFGTTFGEPGRFIDQGERPPEKEVFTIGQTVANGTQPWFWIRLFAAKPHDQIGMRWFRPDGTEFWSFFWDVDGPVCCWWSDVACCPGEEAGTRDEGEWAVSFVADGVELARETFTVSRTGKPEIRVDQCRQYIPDGRTTPIDFGTVRQGGTAPPQVFTVTNDGGAPLTLSSVELPKGFERVEGLPDTLGAEQVWVWGQVLQSRMGAALPLPQSPADRRIVEAEMVGYGIVWSSAGDADPFQIRVPDHIFLVTDSSEFIFDPGPGGFNGEKGGTSQQTSPSGLVNRLGVSVSGNHIGLKVNGRVLRDSLTGEQAIIEAPNLGVVQIGLSSQQSAKQIQLPLHASTISRRTQDTRQLGAKIRPL